MNVKEGAVPGKILLVDDDQEFRSEFRDCFEGYDIIEASGGEEALKILHKPNEIDLAILDVKMPGMDGIELLRRIKDTSPEIGIVILTGYSSKDVVVDALKEHADDYIEKPLDIDEAKEVIEKLLAAKADGPDIAISDAKKKIEGVKHFVERNWAKKVSLKDAAEAVCMSPKYLSRVFKEYAGTGFNEYKLKIKTEKAKELLSKTGYNVNQVTYKMGYKNCESFIRQFKKETGCTPTEYRRRFRNKGKIKNMPKFHLRGGSGKKSVKSGS